MSPSGGALRARKGDRRTTGSRRETEPRVPLRLESKISASEQVEMIQKMIQIIQIAALSVAGVDRAAFVVCPVKPLRKSSEQFGHGQVCLRVPDRNRRVDQPGFSVVSGDIISAPQIAVKQGRKGRLRKNLIQVVQKTVDALSV